MVGNVSGAVGSRLSLGQVHTGNAEGHGPQARGLQSSVVLLGLGGTQGQGSLL